MELVVASSNLVLPPKQNRTENGTLLLMFPYKQQTKLQLNCTFTGGTSAKLIR